MLTIQYLIPGDYDKDKTKLVASILIKNLLQVIKEAKKDVNYKPNNFAIYPVNTFEIAKYKKLLMIGSGLGLKILNKVDESFLKELNENNLKVLREEFKK